MAVDRLEAVRFAQLVAARTSEAYDPMRALCLACTDVLGVTGAGLMLVSGGRSLGCVGVSDPVTETVEQVEYTLGEGPCLAAYADQGCPCSTPTWPTTSSCRWPEFRQGALAAGVRAAFGFPLLVDWICIGALNLYHDVSGALTADQIGDAVVAAQLASRTLLAWQASAPAGNGRVATGTGTEPQDGDPSGDRTDLRAGRHPRRRRARAVARVRVRPRPPDPRRRRRSRHAESSASTDKHLTADRQCTLDSPDLEKGGHGYGPRTRAARGVH